ncbi:hypothetical protein C8R45DRAFT_1106471 [Mycena sanguinolenta]|nr:hypothetical protein C8R45DRAFT_1106471 [Mycena sanguinolenta]
MNPAFLKEVLEVAPRWGSLQFDGTYMKLPMLKQLAQCQFDNLEEIDIRMTVPHRSIAFTIVPRLPTLTLDCHTTMPQTLVPWAQLTELNVHCYELDTALDVLRQCAHLTRATIGVSKCEHHEQCAQGVVQCNQLRFLALDLKFYSRIPPFFNYLSTPVLQILAVRANPRWDPARFTAFQLHTPNITRLEFVHTSFSTLQDLGAAIRHAPLLEHLALRFCGTCFDDVFIQTLYYKDENYAKFTDDILAGMIASRWWTDAELASLQVPPTVARWTCVDLDFDWVDLNPTPLWMFSPPPHENEVVQNIPRQPPQRPHARNLPCAPPISRLIPRSLFTATASIAALVDAVIYGITTARGLLPDTNITATQVVFEAPLSNPDTERKTSANPAWRTAAIVGAVQCHK